MSAIDAHFSAVRDVQNELQKFGAKHLVDCCEIFKLLDNYSCRSDRVQFVTTHLLVRLGLRSNFGEEDIINDPDVSHAVSIPTNQNDNFIWDDTDSSSSSNFICDDTDSSSSRSHVHNVTRDMNSIMDSSTGHAEALAACQFDISFQVHGPESCSSWSSFSSPSSVAGDASENESYIVLNTNVQGSNTKHNLGPNNSHAVSIPTNQSDNCICDVNKNYPNNNIEYQVPVQAEDKQEQLDSTFEDHPEPQPSSSKMNRKAFKRNNVYPFTSRNTKVSKLESAFNKKCQMKVQSTSSATDTKQPDIWKESSTSTSFWEVAKPGTSQADVPAGVPFLQEETRQTRVKLHKCNVCNKTFSDRSNFRKHKRIHTRHCPFLCNICTKAFTDPTGLKQHLRMHSGDRPYTCNVCRKRLNSKFNLKQHHERVHNLFK